jgi:hypothetical protein
VNERISERRSNIRHVRVHFLYLGEHFCQITRKNGTLPIRSRCVLDTQDRNTMKKIAFAAAAAAAAAPISRPGGAFDTVLCTSSLPATD